MTNNNKCYARACDNNNIDCTCMYGNAKEMPCQVNCVRCVYDCKKENGDIACEKFVVAKDSDKCKVWHHCGSDCPEHESRIKTNADCIRAMSDEELAEYIFGVSESLVPCTNCLGECNFCELSDTDCKKKILDWLQSEVE